MRKIRKQSDAWELAKMMEANRTIELQITDNVHSAEIFHLEPTELSGYVYMISEDNVTGNYDGCFFYTSEVAEIIWNNRKYINQSGQLKRMEVLQHNVSEKK